MSKIRNILYVPRLLAVNLRNPVSSKIQSAAITRTWFHKGALLQNGFYYRSFHCNKNINFAKQDQLSEDVRVPTGAVTVGQKVKQAGKDVSYMGILLFGFGVTGALIWYVVSELIFSFSPNSVYSKALNIVKGDSRAIYEIGDGMKGYGEETSRGRRRHVNYQEYILDGVNHMRVQFYVSGKKRKGTVHVEARETSRGNFEFRYVFLELQGLPPSEPIIIIDNR